MKNIKKALAVFLAALTIFAFTPVIDYAVPQAQTSIVAQAAVRLSKKSVTLVVGNSVTLKVKGTKKAVKWSTSNKKVATVKKGKVTAKKAGKATITAKVAGKKYTCKVTVKPEPITVKNIDATYYKATNSKGIVAILKNNNKRAVSVHLSVSFYDENGKPIDTYGDSNYCFEAGRTCALHVIAPSGGYATYKKKITVDESYYAKKTYVKNIVLNHTMNEDYVVCESTNVGKVDLDTIRASVVFFDANGKVMDYNFTYLYSKKSGESEISKISIPYDKSSSSYEHIKPASYKIYVDHAYVY